MGDHAVKQAEQDHQHLPEGIPLGVEDQGGDADQRGAQRQIIHPIKRQKGQNDQRNRRDPQHDLKL